MEELTAMQSFVAALTNSSTGLTASTFYGVLTDLVPWLVIVFGVALGFYLFKRSYKKASHGKAGL